MKDFIQKYVKLWHVNVAVLLIVLQIVNAQWGVIDDYLSPEMGKLGGFVVQILIGILSAFGI